jgi:hypothetical protein
VKHGGGSVMVWGCFGGNSVGDLIKIDGIMKKEQYLEILKNHGVSSGTRIISRGFVFQEDNDPKHSSALCRDFIKKKQNQKAIKIMEWPPQSPDLFPIELLWEELDREVRKHVITSKNNLWAVLQESWDRISEETLNKLINRLPRICKAVIKSKGNHFDEKKSLICLLNFIEL